MRCAIYIRVSTEEQANKEISSLDAQQDLLESYIKNHNYQLVAIYREEGLSGTNIKNRPQLKQLLLDAKLRKFDIMLVTDLDRISRNLRDFLNIWQVFKENGIKFIAINQNIDTSTIVGEALVQQLMVFAELESKMNKQRAEQKRKFEITKKGKWYGGTVPIGFDYDRKAKKLIPNKKEAELVNLIFDLYLAKKSLGIVAKEINQRGFRTRRGKLFSKESIRTILKNPLYVGMVRYKDKAYRGKHESIVDNKKFKEDYEFAISVWNCEAKLIAYRLDEKGRVHYVSLLIEKDIKEKVNSLILDSIYQVGGAINISGWYPFSKELVEFMKENFKKGKIKIENR